MSKNAQQYEVVIDGVTYSVPVETKMSKSAGPTISGEELERAELAVAAQLARRGQATPAAFRFIRKAYGLASKRVAELFGTTPETISRWETGKSELPRYAFLAMAAWTGVNPEAVADACSHPKKRAGSVLVEWGGETTPVLTATQRRAIIDRMTAAAKSAVEGL